MMPEPTSVSYKPLLGLPPELAAEHGVITHRYIGTNRPDKHSGYMEYCSMHPDADLLYRVRNIDVDDWTTRHVVDLYCSVCGTKGTEQQ
jgi:hypothetical protein